MTRWTRAKIAELDSVLTYLTSFEVDILPALKDGDSCFSGDSLLRFRKRSYIASTGRSRLSDGQKVLGRIDVPIVGCIAF